MFLATVNKNQISVAQSEPITSGSVNAYLVQFDFSEEWSDLTRVAVFKTTGEPIDVLLDDTNMCFIPWEVMTDFGKAISFGVYGTRGDEIVLPTIWVKTAVILEGVVTGVESNPPSPTLLAQLMDKIKELEEKVNSIGDVGGAGGGDITVAELEVDEYDTEDGWHVRKWSNGYLELDYQGTAVLPEGFEWVSFYGQYRTNDDFFPSVKFPFGLFEKYSESLSIIDIQPSNITITPYSIRNNNNYLQYSNRHGAARPNNPVIQTDITYTYGIHVTGLWKQLDNSGGFVSANGGSNAYPAEETQIGVYSDGRPIYRRFIECNSGPTATAQNIIWNELNGTQIQVLQLNGTLDYSSTVAIDINFAAYNASGTKLEYLHTAINSNGIYTMCTSSYLNKPMHIIIDYIYK